MAILTGRYGQIRWDATGVGSPSGSALISMNKWQLSIKTNKIDVSCFGDANKVYVPDLKDLSGTLSGFWNSSETTLFAAADATTPGFLELTPNYSEPTYYWSGQAYMDASIDTAVNGAPSVSGSFMAAASWTRHP